MKFCSFSANGKSLFGFEASSGQLVDLIEAAHALAKQRKLSAPDDTLFRATDLKGWLRPGRKAIDFAREISDAVGQGNAEVGIYEPEGVRFLPPITNPGKIIAIGLNYKDHAQEQGVPLPEAPLMFAKFTTSLNAPGQEIRLPSISQKVDPEAELCVIMLKSGRRFSEEDAREAIAGYAVGNDVSARDLQFSDKQWVRGKSCDTFAPCGPYLVTEDEVGDPHNLHIELRLNGNVQQSSSTSNLIFNCYSLVSYISQGITLETGDIIYTGTPSGVGVFREPPVFLKPGDVVEVSIEKLGVLRNPVVAGE
ncbi:MAG: fumarylacetoacetate hydrolase family protein [Acidobacteriota bacterium]